MFTKHISHHKTKTCIWSIERQSYNSVIKNSTQFLKMGQNYEQKFHKRKCVKGQKAHEKLFNISSHQGNKNENHNKISQHAHKNSETLKRLTTPSVGECVEQLELSHTVMGM